MVAPRFEYPDEADVELYAEAYFKIKENSGELAGYDKEHSKEEIINDGLSINYVK